MLLAACDLIRVLKQYCILRNFFIRDVRGCRKELSVFSGGVLCAGGIIQDDMVRIGFAQITDFKRQPAIYDGQFSIQW